jgi:hypothetical protein
MRRLGKHPFPGSRAPIGVRAPRGEMSRACVARAMHPWGKGWIGVGPTSQRKGWRPPLERVSSPRHGSCLAGIPWGGSRELCGDRSPATAYSIVPASASDDWHPIDVVAGYTTQATHEQSHTASAPARRLHVSLANLPLSRDFQTGFVHPLVFIPNGKCTTHLLFHAAISNVGYPTAQSLDISVTFPSPLRSYALTLLRSCALGAALPMQPSDGRGDDPPSTDPARATGGALSDDHRYLLEFLNTVRNPDIPVLPEPS